MPQHPPEDDSRHEKFRDLCLPYGDFNRGVFLEEIVDFIEGFAATKAELSTIRSAVHMRAASNASAPKTCST